MSRHRSKSSQRHLWSKLPIGVVCAGTLAFLAGCGAPTEPSQSEALTITSIGFDLGGPIYTNHKMKARVGIKGKGSSSHVTVSLGLMEAPPAQGAIPSQLSNCLLAGEQIYIPGDGTEQLVDLDVTINSDCTPGKKHNFFVSYGAAEQINSSTGNAIVFSARDAQNPQNQQCHKPSGEAGCVYDIDLRANPGLDMEVSRMVPSSRVAILYPPAKDKPPYPLLTVDSEVALHGRERNTSPTMPGEVYLTYDIAPLTGDSTDWQPLAFDENGTTRRDAIKSITPHGTLDCSHNLYATQAIIDKLKTDWATTNIFNLRSCAVTSFEQHGDPTVMDTDGKMNDCQTVTIQLMRASSPAGLEASTQAWSYNWSQTYGGSSLSITPSFNTTNVIDLTGTQIPQVHGVLQQGARAAVNGQANLGGQYAGELASTPLFQGSAQGVAYVAVANSFVSVSINAFGVNLYSVNRKANIPNPIYDMDWNAMKQRCRDYIFTVIALPITVQFCGSGQIGLTATLTIGNSGVQGQTGQGGLVQGTAIPYANLAASASASVGIPGVSVGIQGVLNLLNARAPLTTSLNWGISRLSPLTLSATGNVNWNLSINTLSGEIDLLVTHPTVNVCTYWGIPYPCGPWTETITQPLYSFQGLTWNYPFLNLQQTLTLSL